MADHPNQQQDGETPGVTAESYGRVDVSLPDGWLFRLPPKLAQAWEEALEGTVLGDLVFTKGGTNSQGRSVKPGFTVHVSEELADGLAAQEAAAKRKESSTTSSNSASSSGSNIHSSSNICLPLNYSLQAMTKKIPLLHPLTRNAQTGAVQLWGAVSRTANLQVDQDASYRALLKDRLVATNITGSRYVKPVETTESVLSRTAATSSTFGDAVYKFGKRRLEALEQASSASHAGTTGPAAKKARRFSPDQALQSVVFELFAQTPYWAVKDLKAAAVAGGATHAASRKAEGELREILREIAEYHRSGDLKNMWELRKQYQQQS
jgi:hypothetical protein